MKKEYKWSIGHSVGTEIGRIALNKAQFFAARSEEVYTDADDNSYHY